MEQKINIAELLKDCPKGTKLYSPIFGEVYLDKIRPHLGIVVTTDKEQGDFKEEFLYDGRYEMNGECMIFPSKGKTTWEGFHKPFKDGDIVVTKTSHNFIFYSIYKGVENRKVLTYVDYHFDSNRLMFNDNLSSLCFIDDIVEQRFATEEEKKKLFNAIKENGYEWNPYTKTLEKYKEETMGKNQPPKTQAEVDKYLQEHSVKNVMNVVDIETCLEMNGLKLPENVVINSKGIGSTQFIQWYEKSKYPKTYEECCNILGIEDRENGYCGYEYELLGEFQQLLICRDAYWKIAGEQMGLGKPWKPDWNNVSDKHCIYFISGEIWSTECQTRQCTLVFPTAEMRDAFYENFKELIDKCKELL